LPHGIVAAIRRSSRLSTRLNLRAIRSIPVRNYSNCAGRIAACVFLLLCWLSSGIALPTDQPDPLPQNGELTSVRVDVRGLDKTRHQQVMTFIGDPPKLQAEEIPAYSEKLKSKTAKALQATGYYNPEITVKHATYKASSIIALNVDAGSPVLIREVDISLNPDAADLTEFKQTLAQLSLNKGSAFDHEVYEKAKNSLLKTSQLLGYFDARLTRAQVLVTRSDNSADIFLNLDTGTRYSIDQVIYKQELYPEDFMKRWQSFETTVPYRANYVSDLTVNLQNSGYFKRVRVAPDLQKAVNFKLPLIVELEPAKENTVGVGIGFATDTGPRLKSNWLRPHTNSRGHTIESYASISRLRQDLSFSYSIPNRKKPASNSYRIDAGVLNHATDDTFAQLRTLEFAEHRLTRSKWRRELFLRLENERFKVGDNKDTTALLLPGIGFSRVVSTGGINPDKGRYFSFQLMAARRSLFSDINMLRATAATKLLKSWNRKHYLIARAELGALRTDSIENVPTTHRFFAGGDNSVRGFSYQEISPRNDDNEAIGGQYLTTASIEYNRYITEKFAIAAFVDSGRAFNDHEDSARTGVGLGLRWRSPVGPLRIDLAHGKNNDESPYRIHLAIGPEL